MLKSFQIENYRHIKECLSLSMLSTEGSGALNVYNKHDACLVKTSLIFGPNNGGKSTILNTLGKLAYIIGNSTTAELTEYLLTRYLKLTEEPSVFNFEFIQKGKHYRYNLVVSLGVVHSEALFENNAEIEEEVFIVENPEQLTLNRDYPHVAEWFKRVRIFNPEYYREVVPLPPFENDAYLTLRLEESVDTIRKLGFPIQQIKYVGSNLKTVYETGELDLHVHEPPSLRWLISFAMERFHALRENRVLLIDDFGDCLHPLMTVHLFDALNNFPPNSETQTLMATHAALLLDRTRVNKDQVWFCSRSRADQLVGLSEFKGLPAISNWCQAYLSGVFGAIPNI
jgi:hypothetical protein